VCDGLQRAAVLQGEACEDRRVAGQHVKQAVAAVVVEEDFSGPAIGIEADGHLKLRAVTFECDRFAGSLVRQAIARELVRCATHRAAPQLTARRGTGGKPIASLASTFRRCAPLCQYSSMSW
jgi:hypothetical protein